MQQVQCISNGVNAIFHKAIDLIFLSPSTKLCQKYDSNFKKIQWIMLTHHALFFAVIWHCFGLPKSFCFYFIMGGTIMCLTQLQRSKSGNLIMYIYFTLRSKLDNKNFQTGLWLDDCTTARQSWVMWENTSNLTWIFLSNLWWILVNQVNLADVANSTEIT